MAAPWRIGRAALRHPPNNSAYRKDAVPDTFIARYGSAVTAKPACGSPEATQIVHRAAKSLRGTFRRAQPSSRIGVGLAAKAVTSLTGVGNCSTLIRPIIRLHHGEFAMILGRLKRVGYIALGFACFFPGTAHNLYCKTRVAIQDNRNQPRIF
jgi:hypothetical protein